MLPENLFGYTLPTVENVGSAHLSWFILRINYAILTWSHLLLGPRKKFDRLLETRREMDLPSPIKCRSIIQHRREYISLMFLFYAIIFAVSFFFYNGAKFFLFKSFFDLISYRIQHASIRSNRPKASMKRSFDLFWSASKNLSLSTLQLALIWNLSLPQRVPISFWRVPIARSDFETSRKLINYRSTTRNLVSK